MDRPWKWSRAYAVALAIAAQLILTYLLLTIGFTRVTPTPPSERPIVVSLIAARPRPPNPVVARITLEPKLSKLPVRLPPLQMPEIHIDWPAQPLSSEKSDIPAGGSPGASSTLGQVGGPLTLHVIHYVAPRYPPQSARDQEHGEISLTLLVDAQGNVEQIKILSSTGWSRLDRAAVSAARQWKFAPDPSGTRGEPVWRMVKLLFSPPQRVLGVPLIVMPYAAVAHQISTEIATHQRRVFETHWAEASLRRLLANLSASLPNESGHDRHVNQASGEDSIAMDLRLLGPIQSVKFVGVVDHGIDRDKSEPSEPPDPPELAMSQWEVYDVKQDHGSSTWLIDVAASGSIQFVEVAMR